MAVFGNGSDQMRESSTSTVVVDSPSRISESRVRGQDQQAKMSPGGGREKVASVLNQTISFLSYEIDPNLITDFIQRRRKRQTGKENGGLDCKPEVITSSASLINNQEVRNLLSRILYDVESDDYRMFCAALRKADAEHYVADFLDSLSVLLWLVTAGNGRSFRHQSSVSDSPPIAQCGCCTCGITSGRHFDIDLAYADRESLRAKAYDEVAYLKSRKRPMSKYLREQRQLVSAKTSALLLGDTADRYVPMISIHLQNHCLCDSQMRKLQRVLESYKCVRDLSIVKTQLDASAKVRLSRALELNEGLFRLEIRLSQLGNDGAMYLANALRRNTSLRVLNLSGNELNWRGCSLLAKGILKNRTLTKLDLGFNEIGEAGCRPLADVLSSAGCTIRKLRMRSNAIGSQGAEVLFESLKKNSRLSLLDLSGNPIGDGSITILSRVLLFNRTLKELNLDNCQITETGCRTLSRPLKSNTDLRCLTLDMNAIGDDGIKALSDGIRYNRSLKELSLNMCCITNAGLESLLNAVRFGCSFNNIKLCYNDIAVGPTSDVTSGHDSPAFGDGLYARLAEILQANAPLKIVLWGNKSEDRSAFRPPALPTMANLVADPGGSPSPSR